MIPERLATGYEHLPRIREAYLGLLSRTLQFA